MRIRPFGPRVRVNSPPVTETGKSLPVAPIRVFEIGGRGAAGEADGITLRLFPLRMVPCRNFRIAFLSVSSAARISCLPPGNSSFTGKKISRTSRSDARPAKPDGRAARKGAARQGGSKLRRSARNADAKQRFRSGRHRDARYSAASASRVVRPLAQLRNKRRQHFRIVFRGTLPAPGDRTLVQGLRGARTADLFRFACANCASTSVEYVP